MTLANAQALRFSPAGLSDSLDETDLFQGACANLQNLIPDPTTKNVWTCRPASTPLTSFTGFTTPGAVSVFKVVGSLVYGLVASGRNAGHDEPFCYDIRSGTFITVSNILSTNVPTTQATTGDWTPPTMDLVGTYLVVTHPGFDGVTNFFGWFDTSNPAAPAWMEIAGSPVNGQFASGSAITLAVIPAWVVQFDGRGYFGINPATGQPSVVLTDSLSLKVTNADQALTFGDNMPLTAAAGLPLNNQLGGIIQSLLIFKGTSRIEQITGDYAAKNITINTLNVATGTLAPRSLASTPYGLIFLAPDGIRLIDFNAHVSDPIGAQGTGVTVPFLSPIAPSRVCAASNAAVLRISVQNSSVAGTPFQEYWYDLVRKVWSGPHTFPASAIGVYGSEFVIAPQGVAAALFLGKVVPDNETNTTENGTLLTWIFQTVMLADNLAMAMSEITQMQLKTSAVATVETMSINAQDENGAVYNTANYNFTVTGSLWGSATWGSSLWGGSVAALYPRRIDFPAPVVYNRLAIRASGVSGAGFQIGDLFIRRRVLGYMQAVS